MRPGVEAAGNETKDAGLALAQISFSKTWARGAGPGTRSRENGTGQQAKSPYQAKPPGRARGTASQASKRAPRGLGARETGTRLPASQPTLPSLLAMLTAPQPRRAVSTVSP